MRDISYSYFIFNLKYVTLQFISCHRVFMLERKTLGNTVTLLSYYDDKT